ncbi:hypothetical protein FK220_009885 [Flavobacteriaceae bacterium TP-CH-4]|uniref:Glutamyl-tRNA reductase n=1 Tax=Pelagihabitans pacificus TaxID=2696054 RepID=A0A967B021_9FLAO|nr:hypothetical protein [Pelagihabitans pacificus]NHF59651.1 hypothetical protein [Pelagihabitans pacificus]
MANELRYLSISHKTASIRNREKFYIADNYKVEVIKQLVTTFPDITGLLLLVTCNRTELYFESDTTSSTSLLNFLIPLLLGKNTSGYHRFFETSDTTEISAGHLLDVSSGLVSKVKGDAEIIYQIKKAYNRAISLDLQGSLLERAMQTVFKTHKRIRNETHFRDGTTSVAYKALKMISDTYGKTKAKHKKILFIGAGDIVRQLFKYNEKFGFENIYIANRTKSRAVSLMERYRCKWFDWDKVVVNDFQDFEIVLSAVANCHHLITGTAANSNARLFLDLALPGNIEPSIGDIANINFYDLDTISSEIEDNKEKRLAAIEQVYGIKEEELAEFRKWREQAPLRELLAAYKVILNDSIKKRLTTQKEPSDDSRISLITNRVMRKLMKYPDTSGWTEKVEMLVAEHLQ